MEKEEIHLLNQLINSVEEAEKKLEESYNKGDFVNFNKLKKFILRTQNEILKMVK